jgi:hypothetical protein
MPPPIPARFPRAGNTLANLSLLFTEFHKLQRPNHTFAAVSRRAVPDTRAILIDAGKSCDCPSL